MQAIESAVSVAAEAESVQAAQKAAADTQTLRELDDKCESLSQQLAAITNEYHATEARYRYCILQTEAYIDLISIHDSKTSQT